MKNTALFTALVFSLIGFKAQSRWMTESDATASVESMVSNTKVSSDGRATNTVTFELKILNEAGRNQYGTMRFNYTPKNQKFKVIKAEVRNQTGTTTVSKQDIVDTPLSATENGFDETRQVIVSFPDVQVGSVLVYELETNIFRPFLSGLFSDRIVFGGGAFQRSSQITIESPNKLHFHVNDPQDSLDFKETQEGSKFFYRVSQKKPIFSMVADEALAYIPSELQTWFVISTGDTYTNTFKELAQKYESMLEDPLPANFQTLVERLKKQPNDVHRVNQLLAGISESIRYMGDWRAVDGGFIPRPLSTIAKTGFGDCKDMSLLTAKALRELGVEASVAWVFRGNDPVPVSPVPYLAFNHAIVSTIVGGKQLWLDPTNFQSYAQGVPQDIVGRDSLVLDHKNPELRRIEYDPAQDNTELTRLTTSYLNSETRKDQVEFQTSGLGAFKISGIELSYSREQIEESTISNAVDRADIINYKFGPWSLKDRIVQPISMRWTIERLTRPADTSMGPGMTFFSSQVVMDLNKVDPKTRKSYVYLGAPMISESMGSISNFKPVGNAVKACRLKSPWLEYTREINIRAQPVRYLTKLTIKKPFISPAEMQSTDFKKLQEQVRHCSRDQILIYSIPSKKKG